MSVKIVKYGSSVLRKRAEQIDIDEAAGVIIEDLFSALKKEKGLGLAGPQIGVLKRVFVMDTTPLTEDDPLISKIEKAVINPEILWFSEEKVIYEEGCLSIPGIYEEVRRSASIRVRYCGLDFNYKEEELEGISARIFQHEYDHLNGILFIDKINPLRRKLLNGKLKKIRK